MFTCVPGVVTAGPWEFKAEGEDEVDKCPGQNDDVTHAAVQQNHLSCIANT